MPSRTLPPDLLPSAGQAELPGLRLIKVPDAAPPYDCETHGAVCPATRDTAGAGSYDTGQSRGSAGRRQAAALAGEPAGVPSTATRASAASVSAALPAAGAGAAAGAGETGGWPRQFAQVIVEILAGSRSPRQIVPLTTDRARRQIGVLAPFLASDQWPKIRRVVTSRPSARVIEMTVVASFGPRSRALAMRFEHMPARPAAPGLPSRPARWLCTDLEAG
jgi:hypothetical protein